MTPFPQDITNPYSPTTFTLPLRPRPDGGSASSGGGHYQTLIQQVSSLTIDDYQTPQGDRHVETRRHTEQRLIQTTTTTTTTRTTTTSRTTATEPLSLSREKLLNPASSSSSSSSSSTTIGPRSSIHNCSSSFCSDFSNAAARTATATRASLRHSKPSSPISSLSEVSSSEPGTGTGGASPSVNKYLRTRRGAMSGPSCPGPGPGSLSSAPAMGSSSSWCSSSSRPSGSRAHGGERLLLPSAPSSMASGSRASGSGSMMKSSGLTRSRAGSITTTADSTNRLNQARLLPSPSRGWPEQDRNRNRTRNGSQIATDPAAISISSSFSDASSSSSSSRSTVRPTDLYKPSESSRVSNNRRSYQPRLGTGEITPEDSISQIGIGTSASASASASAVRRHGGQRSSLSLPIRSLPLSGVRYVSASEVGRAPPPQEDRWILPSSTPGRFGPPPPSVFGDGSSRVSSRRDCY
ncbi:hypothetical protein B0H65DRAFT_13168 [Neurospora tetraspora]|uniref:Uncharacterized protein n=1 Tax=Neurospora tetraspora TaxID=94610 RepID=A0AAE0JNJ3_9PEZI|nr:hypothetical protein B0H65DRAFT_13168 [Neurospora tetraspora]